MNLVVEHKIKNIVKHKSILYVATKNIDYLRIQQEINLLKKYNNRVSILVSSNKNYFIRLIYIYIHLLFSFKKYDVYFVGFAPQLILPLFSWKFQDKITIIDFFISLHDTLIKERKTFKGTSIMSKLIKKLDIFTLNKADWIITDTKEHAKYFVEELKANEHKILTLYLEADKNIYYPRKIEKSKELLDKYIVIYFGSVLPLQGTDVILEAISGISQDDIYFIIIGPIKDLSKYKNLKNVQFLNWLSQEDLANYIAFSDLCLAGHFNANIQKAQRTIPGKAYIYEMMEKDIILGENKANRERYPQVYDKVNFVKMGDPTDLSLKIIELYNIHQKKVSI